MIESLGCRIWCFVINDGGNLEHYEEKDIKRILMVYVRTYFNLYIQIYNVYIIYILLLNV